MAKDVHNSTMEGQKHIDDPDPAATAGQKVAIKNEDNNAPYGTKKPSSRRVVVWDFKRKETYIGKENKVR